MGVVKDEYSAGGRPGTSSRCYSGAIHIWWSLPSHFESRLKYLVKSRTRLPASSSFPRRTPCLPNGRTADDLSSTAFHPSKPICRTNGLSISTRRSRFAGSASNGVSVRQYQVPDRGGFATQMLLEAIQQFDRPLFPSCAQELQKLRVGPDQGHYAPCGFAWFQSALPQRRSVPDLLGDKPGRTGHPRHHFKIRQRIAAKLQFEVPALAGQQRPGSTDAVSVVGAAVRMLTIAVFIVTMIGNTQRCLDLQQRVGDPRRVLNSAIIGAA